MTKILFILSIFSLFTGCSIFIEEFEKDLINEKNIKLLQSTQKTYCKEAHNSSFISEDKISQEKFERFLLSLKKKVKLKFIDEVVLWSLIQINLRPDLSSPTSKIQILISNSKEEYYLNSYSENSGDYPYLKSLEIILKKYKSNYNLYSLAKLLDQNFRSPLLVSKDLEMFLEQNKPYLLKDSKWRKAFIRGDESLKEGETLPKISYGLLIKNYLKGKKNQTYKLSNFLFKESPFKKSATACNFDMNLYSDSIFLISKQLTKANTFGYRNKNFTFLATSSQIVSKNPKRSWQFTFKGNSNTRAPGFCSFETKQSKIWVVSSESRDPGQHIYHLLEYGLLESISADTMDELLKFSRHLFLKSPIRLVIESRRSKQEQMNELLKLNIPIYNSQKLGKIWGFQKTNNHSTFILDDRRIGHISCK